MRTTEVQNSHHRLQFAGILSLHLCSSTSIIYILPSASSRSKCSMETTEERSSLMSTSEQVLSDFKKITATPLLVSRPPLEEFEKAFVLCSDPTYLLRHCRHRPRLDSRPCCGSHVIQPSRRLCRSLESSQ